MNYKKQKVACLVERILRQLTCSGIGMLAPCNCLEIFLQAKQDWNYLCFHCVTLHKTTTHNNWKKEASGDTDGSTNCLRVGGILITSFALKLL